jgi:glycerol-3-phosphate acyltransferase PlsY
MILLYYLLAYIIGAIPTGFIIARVWGIDDITQHGSGNIGATNVARVLGKKFFLLVFFIDAAKAYCYLWLLTSLTPLIYLHYVCAALLLMGNSFSIFLQGKGGKGVATAVGILAFFDPILLGLLFILWLGGFAITRTVGLASVLAYGAFPFLVLLLRMHDTLFLLLSIFISWWGIWRHAKNIKQFVTTLQTKV